MSIFQFSQATGCILRDGEPFIQVPPYHRGGTFDRAGRYLYTLLENERKLLLLCAHFYDHCSPRAEDMESAYQYIASFCHQPGWFSEEESERARTNLYQWWSNPANVTLRHKVNPQEIDGSSI